MAGPPFAPDEPGRIELGTGRWLADVSLSELASSEDPIGAPQRAAASDPLEALVVRIATVIGVGCFVVLLVAVAVLMVQRVLGS
jgi:hypothetical protein